MRLILFLQFATIFSVLKAENELLHVHIIWRDGDHIPERLCAKDGNHFDGQPGAITVKGMKDQMFLGRRIYAKYAEQLGFIEKRFNPKQIYVRAIDVNRTITSATSSMIGMFYNRSESVLEKDYPNVNGWPKGFVPVPIHMLESNGDHICNPDAECSELTVLLDLLNKSTEYQKFLTEQQETIAGIREKCGDGNFDLLNSEYIEDGSRIEKSQGLTPLLSDSEQLVIRRAADFKNGLSSSSVSQNLTAIRGGSLLWDIIDHMDLKMTCIQNSDSPSCQWMNTHKIYMYSLTQSGVDALLAALGSTSPGPVRSSNDTFALLLELRNNTEPTLQISYMTDNDNAEVDITSYIKACGGVNPCPLSSLRKSASVYRISNITQLCQAKSAVQSTVRSQSYSKATRMSIFTKQAKNPTEDELIFLHVIWRHGDRNPKQVCPTDNNNTDSTWWNGFDQLTQLGMDQHRRLGDLIYKEYALKYHLLSETYNPNEMFVRSADLNRTVISAISNLIGMYYDKGNLTDAYPISEFWPAGFVPIPIHTVDDSTDHIADPHAICARKSDLVDISLQTPEIKKIIDDNADVMVRLSNLCGKNLDLLGLATPLDTQQIEQIYNRSTVYNEEDFEQLKALSDIGENVTYGLINTRTYEGYNLQVELATLGGGSLLFDVIDRMDLKIHCLDLENAPECSWIGPLRYYAYSARGETLDALLAALEAKEVFPDGIPDYASAIVVELWRTVERDYDVVIKFRHGPDSEEINDITGNVDGCPPSGRCPLDTFKNRSQPFYPGVIEELCDKRAFLNLTVSTSPVSTTVTTTSGSTSSFSQYLFRFALSIVLVFASYRREWN